MMEKTVFSINVPRITGIRKEEEGQECGWRRGQERGGMRRRNGW